MSTLKMTFSLASLIFLIALIAVPAMAQDTDATFQLPANVPAEGYLILTNDGNDGPTTATNYLPSGLGTPDNVTVMQWSGMPDLEALFYSGGSLILTYPKSVQSDPATDPVTYTENYGIDHDGDDDGIQPDGTAEGGGNIANNGIKDIYENGNAAGTPDYEGDVDDVAGITLATATDEQKATPLLQPGTRALIITEVMWARDLGSVGAAGEHLHQWIEIYNPNKVAWGMNTGTATPTGSPVGLGGTATIASQAGRPAPTAAATDNMLDRVSNVVGAG